MASISSTSSRRSIPEVPVIIISGHGNIETAVAAIKRGAYEYIEKPFKADRLLLVVGRALETSRLKRENEELKGRAGADTELLGSSPAMRQLRQLLKKIAPSNSRVLITGPMGAGKELAARTLHALSLRAAGPFVTLSAATMAPERMEEELFGVEDGTGATRRVGALEEAHGGTLYIDELADMPLETQGKVLRVLVDQTFLRVGGAKKVKVDIRVVSSTSRDLAGLITVGRFREDLYHRLGVVPIAGAEPCGAARGHSGTDRAISRAAIPPPPASRSANSPMTRSPCCRRGTGRATSASSATMSNAS